MSNCCRAYLTPPWWVTMGYAPPQDFHGPPPAGFQPPILEQTPPDQPPPIDLDQPPPVVNQTPPVQPLAVSPDQPPPVINQTPPVQPPAVSPDQPLPGSGPVGVLAVTINAPASVLNLGDALDVSVSLTGPAPADTTLYAIFYQAFVGRYSPIDQSAFLSAPIKVAAGSTTTGFQTKYQNLSPPGTYVVSIVTADDASHVADITQLPVTTFASFIIQGDLSAGASTQPTSAQTQATSALAALSSGRQDITIGDQPFSLVFDGTNIWALCQGSVSAVSASNGYHLGTFPVDAPTGGASIPAGTGTVTWVASSSARGVPSRGGSFSELVPTGQIVITEVIPQQPAALAAFQDDQLGTLLYFTDLNSDLFFRFDPNTRITTAVGRTGIMAAGVLLFDGTNFWLCNGYDNVVVKIDPNGVGRSFPVGSGPDGLAFDGNSIWVTNFNDNTISKLSANDGQVLQTVATGFNPGGIAFDGVNLWVANSGGNTLTQIRANDGVVLGNLPTGPTPTSVVFDGAHIWVANSGTNTITKY